MLCILLFIFLTYYLGLAMDSLLKLELSVNGVGDISCHGIIAYKERHLRRKLTLKLHFAGFSTVGNVTRPK